MKLPLTVFAWCAVALVSVAVYAADAPKEKGKKGKKPAGQLTALVAQIKEKAELTEEQTQKLDALVAEHEPKLAAANEKLNSLLTAEQKQARAAAAKQAKTDGKKGKDLQAAIDAALNLSDDQKQVQADARKATGEIQAAFRTAVRELLTPEQIAKVGLKGPKAPKKNKKNT